MAYTLYRWEMNIRMAAVLGFVGAGGLGQLLYFHLSIFQQAQAATVLIAMFVLVFAVDSLSAWCAAGSPRARLSRRDVGQPPKPSRQAARRRNCAASQRWKASASSTRCCRPR